MSRGAALEAYRGGKPEERFAELRKEIAELLNRSDWDKDGMQQIYLQLDVACIRMACTCQKLMGMRM